MVSRNEELRTRWSKVEDSVQHHAVVPPTRAERPHIDSYQDTFLCNELFEHCFILQRQNQGTNRPALLVPKAAATQAVKSPTQSAEDVSSRLGTTQVSHVS